MPVLQSLIEIWRTKAEQNPDRAAYTFCNGDERTSITLGELDLRARSIAAKLQQVADPGDRVLLIYPPGLEFVSAFMGCVYAGLIAVPATQPKPRRPLHRLATIAADCQASLGLGVSQLLASLQPRLATPELAAMRWIASDELSTELAGQWQPPACSTDDLALLQYTSGSTSEPKGVMVSHGNLLHNLEVIRQIRDSRGLGELPPQLQKLQSVFWLPPYHDMGLIGGILGSSYLDAHCTLLSPAEFLQRPWRWLELLSEMRAHISSAPNFAFDLCVRKTTPEQRRNLDLSDWRIAYCGAEPIRPETVARFCDAFQDSGFRREAFYPVYGLAESTLLVTGGRSPAVPEIATVEAGALQTNHVRRSANAAEGRRLVGCGLSWDQQEIAIADPSTQQRCRADEVGEIWVRGPSVARGYWNRPEETKRVFRAVLASEQGGPWLRTGDLGFVAGEHLFVTGRLKDVIIIRGQNHYPQDIEATVGGSHAAIVPGAAAAFARGEEGELQLIVVSEVARQSRHADMQEVVAAIRREVSVEHGLTVHAVSLIREATLPRTTSGKIQRYLCRDQFVRGELKQVFSWQHELVLYEPVATDDIAGPASPPTPTLAVLSAKPSFFAKRPRFDRPERLAREIESGILQWLVERAGVPRHEVDPEKPFAEYGIDSLTAVELSHELQDWLQVTLTPVVAWAYPTPRAIAPFLAGLACGTAAPDTGADDESPVISIAYRRTNTAYEQLLAEIEQLSDAEAEARTRRAA